METLRNFLTSIQQQWCKGRF